MPNASNVSVGDQATAAQINNIIADLPDPVNGAGINFIRNYQSKELADGVAPEWWETNNCTLTEEDASGEALGFDPKYERILKGVTTGAGGYVQQTFDPDEEYLLYAGESYVSTGVWVYTASSGTLKFSLRDSVSGEIDSVLISPPLGGMYYMEMMNRQIGSDDLQWRIEHSANGATFYFSKPMLNLGKNVFPWVERKSIYREIHGAVFDGVDPGGAAAGWQDVDLSSVVGNNAVKADLVARYINTTNVGSLLSFRRKGATAAYISTHTYQNLSTTLNPPLSFEVMLDDDQNFQYQSNAAAGDAESLYLYVKGAYIWEGAK